MATKPTRGGGGLKALNGLAASLCLLGINLFNGFRPNDKDKNKLINKMAEVR